MTTTIEIQVKMDDALKNELFDYMLATIYGDGDYDYYRQNNFNPFIEDLQSKTMLLENVVEIVCNKVYDSMDFPYSKIGKYVVDIINILLRNNDIQILLNEVEFITSSYIDRTMCFHSLNWYLYDRYYLAVYIINFVN